MTKIAGSGFDSGSGAYIYNTGTYITCRNKAGLPSVTGFAGLLLMNRTIYNDRAKRPPGYSSNAFQVQIFKKEDTAIPSHIFFFKSFY